MDPGLKACTSYIILSETGGGSHLWFIIILNAPGSNHHACLVSLYGLVGEDTGCLGELALAVDSRQRIIFELSFVQGHTTAMIDLRLLGDVLIHHHLRWRLLQLRCVAIRNNSVGATLGCHCMTGER